MCTLYPLLPWSLVQENSRDKYLCLGLGSAGQNLKSQPFSTSSRHIWLCEVKSAALLQPIAGFKQFGCCPVLQLSTVTWLHWGSCLLKYINSARWPKSHMAPSHQPWLTARETVTALESLKGGYEFLNHGHLNLQRSEPPSFPCEWEWFFCHWSWLTCSSFPFLRWTERWGQMLVTGNSRRHIAKNISRVWSGLFLCPSLSRRCQECSLISTLL